ncbi:MAG: hypothetical protein R2824_17120 [Saprospiraceae bacterium]|nr:hypothetical protein [Lewinella sp.]
MQGELIYKSEKSKLEIYRSGNQIVVSGSGKNEILRTFELESVCNEISYSNEQKNMYIALGVITLIFIIYGLYRVIFLDAPITWQDFAAIGIISIMGTFTYLTNDGFNGWLKFQNDQQEQITVSNEEFNQITDVLINELKNGISGKASL